MNQNAARVVVFLTLIADALAQAPPVPFVAGFDRFARHGDIDPVTSGRLLLTELSCTACHATKSDDLMPKPGPRLEGVGNRIRLEWIRRFLSSPQVAKPGTTMPDVLAGFSKDEKSAAIEALVAFLGSQRQPFPEIAGSGARPVPHEFWNRGRIEEGRQLYHRVGCVACHAPDPDYETVETKPSSLDQLLEQLDPDELKELGLTSAARRVQSVPHGDLPAKYSRQSLTFFLLDPEKTRPAGRMPNLKLTVVEAANIAAWLLRNQSDSPTGSPGAVTKDEALVKKGRMLFRELRCANCHSAGGVNRGEMAKPLAEVDLAAARSCLGPPGKGIPHYRLDEAQAAAVRSALAETVSNVESPKAAQLQFQMLQLNCLACHERNRQGGVGRFRKPYFETVDHVDIGDEGRLPPPLTGAGGKLSAASLSTVLKGTGDVRPFMRIRMPVFPPAQVKALPQLLAQADSGRQPAEKEVFGDFRDLAEAGRLLLDTGCVQCHPLRGEALPGVVGVDLVGIATRVHPKWFHDFLLDPGKLKPRTRMPTFFPAGKSQNREVLDGDTERQIAAMWAYLKDLDHQKLPPKIEKARSQNYELIPKDRPIVLRTFMDQAGTHAVAIGFPQRVHFAFDAEQIRPALAWRGQFLDAQGTWFVRFAPPARPLGEDQISLPAGVPFALLENEDAPWPEYDADDSARRFSGYKLDKDGVPTFRYRFGSFHIEDRIEPAKGRQLVRRIRIDDRTRGEPSSRIWFRGNAGKTLQRNSASSYTNDAGLTVSVAADVGRGHIRERVGKADWVIPIEPARRRTIEVQYRW